MKYCKHILLIILALVVAVPSNAQHKGKKKYKNKKIKN